MGQHCYELATVWFRYADPWILEAFDLTIDPGEFLGVIGPNGSGKTSLLKLMAGLLHPQEGVVRLQGHDLSILPPREIARHVAVVPQESHVLFPFTVAELVLMGGSPQRIFVLRSRPWKLWMSSASRSEPSQSCRAGSGIEP
jgi:iron complex transport system ATP-binding protein